MSSPLLGTAAGSSTAASSSHNASTSFEFPDDPFSEPRGQPSPYLQHSGTQHERLHPSSSNDSLAAWAKTTRFNVLNHFSQVTNVARNGAHSLLSSPLFQPQESESSSLHAREDGGSNSNKRNNRTSVASLATSFLQHGPVGPLGPSDPDWKQSDMAKKSGTGEYDSARVYLAKWAKMVAEEGEANRSREQEKEGRLQQLRPCPVEDTEVGAFELWDLFPCIEKPRTTRMRNSAIGQDAWSALFDEDGRPTVSFSHMKQLVFQHGFGNGKHSVKGTGWDQIGPRAECWSFLLGAQEWLEGEDIIERRKRWDTRAMEYWSLRPRTEDPLKSEAVEKTDPFWREQKHRIRVDCLRVDKKLPLFRDKMERQLRFSMEGRDVDEGGNELDNIHIQRLQDVLLSYVIWDQAREDAAPAEEQGQLGGYVQGMSDLCAPLYSLCHGDEAKTFWLFVGLMKRMRRNFYTDQSGMKMQLLSLQKLILVMDPGLYHHLEKVDSLNLFFCFRWLLVCFKREFLHPEILMLWEAIFSANVDDYDNDDVSHPTTHSHAISSPPYQGISNHFQVFIAFAILEHHRDILMKHLHNFDELLQYMNGLSFQIDVDTTIAEAEVLCLSLHALNEEKSLSNQSQATVALPVIDDDLKVLVSHSPV
ncbi:hypothetical protein CBS101457_006270 [Exobasidium rhododendri]|nr:hypothetical protein CBS101457_006270 [Exobasidium rhododendri]